jgi:hypothetical protein
MRKVLLLSLLLIVNLASAQERSFSVYLIGDTGEDTIAGKALLMLKKELIADTNSAVVFLGDNIYPSGFSKKKPGSVKRMDAQLHILDNYKGWAYFIPGNHDWDAQRRKGYKKILEQEEYINNYVKNTSVFNKDQSAFLPAGALPGPASVLLTNHLRLIIIDTQWFLHAYKKGKKGSKKHTKETFYLRLDSLLAYSKMNDQQVIITAHHPIFTNGEHSRKIQPVRFLVTYTPFRIFGFGGLDRLLSQDLSQVRYRKMRRRMLKNFDRYDNITYASGHDHNLQLFKENGNRYIVSGCGSKISPLRRRKLFKSYFEDDSSTGFVKLEFFENNKIVTSIYRVGKDVTVMEGY